MADLLIGRSVQLNMLIRVLTCAKLINVTGALGIGKTFFVKQMYRSVTYAPKAFISLGTPGLISIEAEGVETYHIEPGMILDVLDMLDELGASSCESLLVLDGCESALEPCLAMVESALVRFPTMRIAATSQVPLHIPGEICFELPPLSLPPSTVSTLEELNQYEAGVLFTSTALEVNPTFMPNGWDVLTIAHICNLLRGIPLPIKIVAMQSSNIPVVEIASRLLESAYLNHNHGEGNSMTLDGSDRSKPYDESWPTLAVELLPDDYKELLIDTGICVGGATPDILETIDKVRSRNQIMTQLSYLTNISLISTTSKGGVYRYYITEPIRKQIPMLLSKRTDQIHLHNLHKRFIEWCIGYVTGAERGLISGHTQKYWLEKLDNEYLNIRQAIQYAVDSGYIEAACRIGAEIWRYYELRNKLQEGQQLLVQMIGANEFNLLEPALVSRIYDGLGMIYWRQGDYNSSTTYFESALNCISDSKHVTDGYRSRLFNHLGLALAFAGNSEEALKMYYMAADGSKQCGNHGEAALALANIGLVYAEQGHLDEARTILLEALGDEGIEGDIHAVAITWLHLGIVDLLDGRNIEARRRFYQAADNLMTVGDERSAAFAVAGYAVASITTRPREALILASVANTASINLGAPAPEYWHRKISEAISSVFTELEEVALTAWAEGQCMSLFSALDIMKSFESGEGTVVGKNPVYDSEKPQGIHIKLFGGFSIIGANGQIVVNGKPKKALAAIAANGGSIHAEKLIEILWPYADPKLARRRIRNVLLRLKQYSGSIVMRHDEEIKLNQTVEVDLIQFMNLARQSITALTNGSWGDHTHDDWNTAISTIQLYSGDLLPEYAYDEWVIDAQERTKRLYISLLSLLARKACEEGSPAATGWLETLIAADPYDDSSYILLAELHYNEGRDLAALDTIRRARSVAGNLEIPLSAKLLQLEERIRPKHPPRR